MNKIIVTGLIVVGIVGAYFVGVVMGPKYAGSVDAQATTQVCVNILSSHLSRVTAAFDKAYSGRVTQDENGDDVVNFTKNAWAKEKVRQYVVDVVKFQETEDAGPPAVTAVDVQ